jgi:hypothetical protein
MREDMVQDNTFQTIELRTDSAGPSPLISRRFPSMYDVRTVRSSSMAGAVKEQELSV